MKTTTETVKNVTYSGGSRIATVEQTCTRADDAEKLGNLYFRLSDLYRRIDANPAPSENELTALNKDLEVVLADIETYKGYLAGYETATAE